MRVYPLKTKKKTKKNKKKKKKNYRDDFSYFCKTVKEKNKEKRRICTETKQERTTGDDGAG